jgi:hypothetical protein
MPSRKSSAKNFAILLADPDSQPTDLRSVAATCDRIATGHVTAAPPIAPSNVRLPMWTIIGTSLDGVAHNQQQYHHGAYAPTVRFGSKSEILITSRCLPL